MKKFVVESIHDVTCADINIALDLRLGSAHHWKVTELKPLPEVRKIETGVLKESVCTIIKNMLPLFENKRIEVVSNCRDLFEDIRTEWDFSSIPMGSLVEVITDNDMVYYGKFRFKSPRQFSFGNNDWNNVQDIKSIRIIELPREATNEGSC